jgi:hypothetical protein
MKKLPSAADFYDLIRWYLFLLALALILGGLIKMHNSIWGEREGVVKVDDCRNSIEIQEGSVRTWFKTFTCTAKKTESGKIISGFCHSVVTEGSVCQTVYTYSKKPEIRCSNPNFSFPGYDDICHSNAQ